jgi:hypothetical protein
MRPLRANTASPDLWPKLSYQGGSGQTTAFVHIPTAASCDGSGNIGASLEHVNKRRRITSGTRQKPGYRAAAIRKAAGMACVAHSEKPRALIPDPLPAGEGSINPRPPREGGAKRRVRASAPEAPTEGGYPASGKLFRDHRERASLEHPALARSDRRKHKGVIK